MLLILTHRFITSFSHVHKECILSANASVWVSRVYLMKPRCRWIAECLWLPMYPQLVYGASLSQPASPATGATHRPVTQPPSSITRPQPMDGSEVQSATHSLTPSHALASIFFMQGDGVL